MTIPSKPKIYHIVHADRLSSIISDGYLWCDRETIRKGILGTTIGLSDIKRRRLDELTLSSHPNLYVGDCVPFYFCPRSVMLYLIFRGNHPELVYRGGQGPIVHLELDLHEVVEWANRVNHNWAFTTSNAGSYYFDDYSQLTDLDKIDWAAIAATDWRNCKEGKQAEFMLEYSCPWELVERIGVSSRSIQNSVQATLQGASHQPPVAFLPGWYY